MKHKNYLSKVCGNAALAKKTIIVTGATGSIGREICACCLMLGADVVMAVRNTAKGEIVRAKLARRFPADKITISELDVSNPASIDKFAASLPEKDGYCLVNNAGALSGGNQYMTNFLGPMYLSGKLDDKLGSRLEKIVFQSSLSYAWKKSCPDWTDPRGTKIRSSMKRYGRTKRLINLTILALENPKYCAVHPGVCSTNIIPTRILRALCRPIFHSARTAALPAVLALSRDFPQTHMLAPRAFGIWGRPKLRKIQKLLFDREQLSLAREHIDKELCGINSLSLCKRK